MRDPSFYGNRMSHSFDSSHLEGGNGGEEILRNLSPNSTYQGDIIIDDCNPHQALTIPDGVTIMGKLIINDCQAVIKIGKNVTIAGDCYISYCMDISEIPDNFYVQGDLGIYSCENLSRFGNGIAVEGDVMIRGCKVQQIPNMEVGGHMDIM